jgi:hypothetical protein
VVIDEITGAIVHTIPTQNAVGNGSITLNADAAAFTKTIAALDRKPFDAAGDCFAGLQNETASLKLTVYNADVGSPRGFDGQVLAKKVNIHVSIPGVGSIRDQNGVPNGGCVHCRLDGCELGRHIQRSGLRGLHSY